MSHKHRSGHYCWSCNRVLANEKFSGQGHARHLCRDCARLGKDELAYRQAIRDLERLVTQEGTIPRKKQQHFRRFLEHVDQRVRSYAQKIEAAGVPEGNEAEEDQGLTATEFDYPTM